MNMRLQFRLRKIIALVIVFCFFVVPYKSVQAAGSLSDVAITLTSNKPLVTTGYTVSFKPATTETLRKIHFIFTRAQDNSNKPATLDLSNISLDSLTGLSQANWSVNTSNVATGVFDISYETGELVGPGTTITLQFNHIRTPELGACTVPNSTYDICYLDISTYSDGGDTLVDNGGQSYRIEDIPALTFNVNGVTANTETNGITTTIATDSDTIDFGSLLINKPEFAAQKLFASTTAPGGYSVTMKLDGLIQGLVPANQITPFLPTNGAWVSPQEWVSPEGSSNSGSGWVGANTSDGRIDSDPILHLTNIWSNGYGAGKFGPVSSTAHEVMYSSGRDRDGTEAYVTYGIEINEHQPPDHYIGILDYDILSTY